MGIPNDAEYLIKYNILLLEILIILITLILKSDNCANVFVIVIFRIHENISHSML